MDQLDWKLLKAVYAGGIRRGADEASAYEWGASPSGKQYDDLVEAVYDHVNDGRKYDDPAYVTWDAVEAAVAAMPSPTPTPPTTATYNSSRYPAWGPTGTRQRGRWGLLLLVCTGCSGGGWGVGFGRLFLIGRVEMDEHYVCVTCDELFEPSELNKDGQCEECKRHMPLRDEDDQEL